MNKQQMNAFISEHRIVFREMLGNGQKSFDELEQHDFYLQEKHLARIENGEHRTLQQGKIKRSFHRFCEMVVEVRKKSPKLPH